MNIVTTIYHYEYHHANIDYLLTHIGYMLIILVNYLASHIYIYHMLSY